MQHFTASDGARIAYEDVGSGRPLVLLHGLMAHRDFYGPQGVLADEFRLIGIDLRGHGASVEAGRPLSIERLAADVAELCAMLDLRGVIGIGWSLGASVLWRILAGPEGPRFAGSVIIDMSPRVLNAEAWQLGLSPETCEARSAAMRDDFSTFAVNAGQAIFAQPVAEDKQALADWASFEFSRNDPSAIGAVWQSLVEEDSRPSLARVFQPSIITHGANSQLYGPGTADYLAAALPNARAVRFEHSGHALHLEEPEKFNRLIRDFAAGLPAVRESYATAS